MRRILIVEDGPACRVLLAALAERTGLPRALVMHARDASTALEAAEALPPDVAFVGLQLPNADGSFVVRRLLDKNPRVAVVAVTSLPRHHPRVARALDEGARAVLRKPLTLPAFLRACNEAGVREDAPDLLRRLSPE